MESTPRKRRRPALSCLECRRRKIKCDRNQPCSHCVSTRSRCNFKVFHDEPVIGQQVQEAQQSLQVQQTRQTPSSAWGCMSSPTINAPTPISQPTLTNFDTRASTLTSEHNSNPTLTPGTATATTTAAGEYHGIPSPPNRDYNQLRTDAQDIRTDIQSLLERVQKLESSASVSSRRQPETGQDILRLQSGIQDSQVILKKTRALNWSEWIGQNDEFIPIYNCYAKAMCNDGDDIDPSQNPELRHLYTRIGDIMRDCKLIAKRMKTGRPSRNLSCSEFNLEPPSREIADIMATFYFESFESTYRILHIPSFWKEYHKYWNDPESATTGMRLQILLVIGIGSSLHRQGNVDIEFHAKVRQWVYAAQTWLSGPLEKDRLNITGIQVHCLTLLARQVFSIGNDLVWMSTGSLVHRAIKISLHRDPKYLPPMSILQAEVRRRLWTTILEMVVQMSLDSAMPPRISFAEFDIEAPSNINDDEIDASTTVLQGQPRTTFTTTSMQLLLLDSLPARLRILQLLSDLHSEISYPDVLTLSSEITDACQTCTRFLKENESESVTAFHRNLLDFFVRRFLIPLHCTFAVKARENPLFYYSLKVSLDTALLIVSPEPDERFSHLEVIGGGIFREGIRFTMTVISLELVAQTEAQRLDGTLHRNAGHREVLKQALRGRIALSLDRIKQGETNIKTHMFLSMILAQVEAIEEGSSCELKIARSAKDSIELCHGLLQELANSVSLPGTHDLGLTPMSFDGGLGEFDMNFDLDFFLRDEGFS